MTGSALLSLAGKPREPEMKKSCKDESNFEEIKSKREGRCDKDNSKKEWRRRWHSKSSLRSPEANSSRFRQQSIFWMKARGNRLSKPSKRSYKKRQEKKLPN